jgi:DNA/RNA endonuclease YhcR with UshA esterase domain
MVQSVRHLNTAGEIFRVRERDDGGEDRVKVQNNYGTYGINGTESTEKTRLFPFVSFIITLPTNRVRRLVNRKREI